MKRAADLSLKSGCLRAKVATVMVKDDKVLVEAYNRVFPTNEFCAKNGCLRDKLGLGLGREAEKCRSIHSEAGAIAKAGKKGISLAGATAYVTCAPCMNCAKLLVVSGIVQVYYLDNHADKTPLLFLEKMRVGCERMSLVGDKAEKRLRDTGGQK